MSIYSGSLALMADAIHSGTDVLVSSIVLIGLRISRQKAVSSPIRYRIESAIAILISFFIWISAFFILKQAFTQKTGDIKFLPLAIGGSLLSIIITYFIAQYKIHVGRITNSPGLLADGEHSKTDMYSSIAVLFGLTGYMVGFELDNVIAAIVGILIILVGVKIFRIGLQAFEMKNSLLFIKSSAEYFTQFDIIDLKKQRGKITSIAVGLFALLYLFTGLYIILPGQEGIVLRFGRIVEQNIKPGLHFHFPPPVEQTMILDTKNLNRIEIGFRTRDEAEEEPPAYLWETTHLRGRYIKQYAEALMLTGDQNIVDANISIQYILKDSAAYLFNVDDPVVMIRGFAETAIRYSMATKTIERILIGNHHKIEEEIHQALQGFFDKMNLGIQVISVDISEIHPPKEIVKAFREVANAQQDKDRYISEAESYLNETVPLAKAEAATMVEEARAYKISKINKASGEAERFTDMLEQYKNAETITRDRIYLETMEKVLAKTNKIIMGTSKTKDILDLRQFSNSSPGRNQ